MLTLQRLGVLNDEVRRAIHAAGPRNAAQLVVVRDTWDVFGFSGLQVDEPVGPRWELALALIDSGEGPVMLGSVELRRATSGPTADGVISVVVGSSTPTPTEGLARAEVELARANVSVATRADPRLEKLLDRYGSRWELVDDYGTGTLLLAHIDSDGNLAWEPGHRPT